MPDLEAALRVAEDERAARAAAAAAERASAEEAGEGAAATEESAPPLSVTFDAEETEAADAVTEAARRVEQAKEDLASCEAALAWKPPPAPGQVIEEVAPAPKAKAKAKAKAAPAPTEAPPEPQVEKVADVAVEHLVATYLDQHAVAMGAVEQCNARARQEEEERQHEAFRRARAKAKEREAAAAAKAKAKSPTKRNKLTVEPEEEDFTPVMDDWVQPVSDKELTLCEAPFELLFEEGRNGLPMALIPAEMPLPAPSVVQLLTRPPPREARVPPPKFKILTPVPASTCHSERPSSAALGSAVIAASRPGSKAQDEMQGKRSSQQAAQDELQKPTLVPDITRWIIEPLSEQRLFVHFASEEVGVYETTLNFEMIGDSVSGPIPVRVTGTSALPAFNSDTRFIFPKRKKQRPLDGFAVKTFVTSLNTYDFGPLLVGRDPEGRVGAVNASGSSAADGEAKPGSAGRDLKQDKFFMNHAETIKISNDSLFPANIRLGLVSQEEQKEDPAPPPPEPKKAAKGKEQPPPLAEKPYCPFIVEPSVLQLGIGEQADVRIWCFPKEKGVLEDTLLALVEHNPDPVVFSLCAVGTEPTVILDTEEVDMDRLLVNWRAEERRVRLKNASSLPTAWQLVCDDVQVMESPEPVQAGGAKGKAVSKEPSKGKAPPAGVKGGGEGLVSRQVSQEDDKPPAIPEEFQIEPLRGKLAPGEEFEVRINFRAARAMEFKCGLRLESKDCEGFKGWESAGRFAVQAKTFEVDMAIEPDPLTSLLDFGTVLVHSSVERTFDVVNRGRFAARYELNVRKALRDLLVIDKAQAELAPGERRTVKVTCMPARVYEAFIDNNGISALVFDTVTGNQVDQKLPPVRVGVTAVYNQFQVTPPRGVNFGPVEKGEIVTRTFSVRNIGLFAFDWALFDQAEPPTVGDDGAPVVPKDAKDGKLKAGPFTVRPCTGSLEPDSDTQVEVTFEAQGDEDYESRLGLWVDGVDCAGAEQRVGSATRVGSTAMQSFNGTFGAAGGVGGVEGAAAYTLTAQSCIAGINTKDLQTIFEEQFFTRNLEDAIAIAGRVDVRVFCESDHIFHFGPVLALGGSGTQAADSEEKGVVERLRLSNPKAIPAKVALSVTSKEEADAPARDKGKKAAADDACAFEVSPKELVIPPHDSRHIEVSFRPSRIATFGALLEANVMGGTDPATNQLAFELRGDGAMPSVNLVGPVLVGDDGVSTLQMGSLTVSKRHEVRMALRNSGLLPATVRVDLAPTPHFTVACPYSIPLDKGEEHTFSVCFHPTQPGPAKAELNIRTLGNPFEDYSGPRAIQVTGEGFSDQIAWDLHEVKLPHAAQAQLAEGLSQVSAPSPPNDLQLGEVEVGQEVCVNFQLANKTAHPVRFEMPEAAPAPFGARLSVQPSTGFVHAGAQQPVALTFKPTEKLEANKVLLACKTFQVELEDEGADGAEPKFQELPGTMREVPLMVSAVADVRRIQCETREIKFSETMMFNTKVHRFTVRNLCSISVPFQWHVEGENGHAFSVEPASGAVPPSAEQQVAVRFAPLEVEDFCGAIVCSSSAVSDTGEPPEILRIPVSASALRPWCRVELESSDYPSRRLADSPLDPKCRVCEITSLGTNVKNTKRFYVANPTSESVDFVWQKETPSGPSTAAQAEDDDTLRCLTKRGTILPGKKFEMAFEFAPSTVETKESFWVFMLVGPRVEEHFLIAGTVEQPRVGFDRPHINFGERLLGGATQETLCLVNKEHIPFSFSIDPLSFQPEGQTEALSIKPLSGVVSPNSSLSLQVTFAPEEEQPFNFNVVCNVKRKKDPVILNVKGIGYKIHASLAVDEPAGRRAIQPGVVESLDFGLLQVHERRTMKLYLSNDTKRNFNYRLQMKSGAQRRTTAIGDPEQPPYLAFSNLQGIAEHSTETPIEITYAPRDGHSLDGSTLQVMVPAGPREDLFTLNLAGSAKKSRVEFSFVSHDFGPCFVAKDGATAAGEPLQDAADQGQERVELVCTNRDDNDIHIATNFQREPWLDVQLHSAMVESGKSIRIPIVFSPREICEYMQRVEFSINEYTRTAVDIRGRGCPLRLEVAQIEMQNVDFGVVVGGEVPVRAVKLANRSARPVSFELVDENGELTDRAVTWAPGPGKAQTLKPKETCDVELRFAPTYSIKPFRFPLYARCNNGVEVKLFQVAGTGHSTEVRLSEQSLFFGNVVVGSQASRSMRLHNFGDIGAKFRFEIPEKYSKVFSVSPCEGFARPQEDVSLTVTFSPTAGRVQSVKRTSKSSSPSKRPAADVTKDMGISTRDIRCVLEGHPPLKLEASGRCVSLPAESKTVAFSTEVRTKTQSSIMISNPTDSDWKLFPQVSMTEPQGETYFSCPKEVVVPAGKQIPVEVTYMPLTMTVDKDTAAASRAAASRSEKHRGTIFVGTPDGSALLYSLEGVALPIKANQRLEAQVPCKKQHVQKVPLKNWLHSKQRFDVKMDLVNPAPGTAAAQGITLQGVNTLDLPGGVEREYRFNIYAYHEGSALVNVRFTSQETGEYIIFEVALKFCAPEKLATINLEAACRQTARHKIAVANPLDTPAKFTGSCSNPYVRFSPDSVDVPAKGEKTIDLLFRPVEEGDGEAEATLNSNELGTYPYRVAWKATPAGFEKTMVLKAPLGGSAVEKFKFLHFASGPVTYTASVEPAPGGKGGNVADFVLEAKDVKADACDFGRAGVPCELAVRYTPSSLGERHALLTVSGTGGGEYKALLTGFAQPPQPQGPIAILNGKQGTVEFRNPFDVTVEFSVKVDNPCFTVPQKVVKLDTQKSTSITVTFKSDRSQNGRLVISCEAASMPWVFFLKGDM
jgi:hydrocephalus-inducing protein